MHMWSVHVLPLHICRNENIILPITAGVTTAVYNKNMAVDPTQKIPVVWLAMSQLLIRSSLAHTRPSNWWPGISGRDRASRPTWRVPREQTKTVGRPDVKKPKKKKLKKIWQVFFRYACLNLEDGECRHFVSRRCPASIYVEQSCKLEESLSGHDVWFVTEVIY